MKYIDQVISGKVKVNKFTRLAVERHINDLTRTDIYFDPAAAERAVKYMKLMPQSKGQFAGKKIDVQPWQEFTRSMIYGWKNADGTRRFRTAYIEIARKNGKTTEGAVTGNYALTSDGEAGAEVYYAATKRDQALICFREAQSMVKKSQLRQYAAVLANAITYKDSFAKPLSSDENTMSGLNTHTAIIDEIHEHKTSGVIDVITTSIGARIQPLIYEITTAGKNKSTICYDHHRLTENILLGSQVDDSWFGIIYTLDKDDDWNDRDVWVKSNPNLGVSKKWQYMEHQYRKATNMLSYVNTFLQLDLNVWTDSHSRWLEDEIWVRRIEDVNCDGMNCWGGLDTASTRDFSALVLCFQVGDKVHFKRYFWIPETTFHQRQMNANAAELEAWRRDGHLKVTPGNAMDFNIIVSDIRELNQRYNIQWIGYDRYKAETLASLLDNDNIQVVEFGQGYVSMSEPVKELEKYYLDARLTHDGNPVQRWMFGNVLIVRDPADNVKIDKSKSTEKVDGAVAEVMAMGTYLKKQEEAYTIDPDIWRK